MGLTTLLDGFVFNEGPRWHDGALWFSDMHDHRVVRVTLTDDGSVASVETVVEVSDDEPSGLGWMPDGRLLVVAMESRRLLRLEPDGSLVTHADLSHVPPGSLNDMIVAADGTAYVGNMGYSVHHGDPRHMRIAESWIVFPDGTVELGADELRAPNGHVLTPDEGTLIVAESAGLRLTAFDRGIDGRLSGRRTYAALVPSDPSLPASPPDGICLDAEGAVWFADPLGRRVVRVREGGEVTDVIPVSDGLPVACVLGGDDRRTLFVCACEHWSRDVLAGRRTARIDVIPVDVPGAGKP